MVKLIDPPPRSPPPADGDAALDAVFAALADSTRRAVLTQLGQGEASVSDLARTHDMSLPGFMKHLRVLEDAGLIARAKEGRVVRCTLLAEPMQEAAMWIAYYEQFWNARLDALGRFLYHQEEIKPWKPQPQKNLRSPSAAPIPLPRKGSGRPGPTRKR